MLGLYWDNGKVEAAIYCGGVSTDSPYMYRKGK